MRWNDMLRLHHFDEFFCILPCAVAAYMNILVYLNTVPLELLLKYLPVFPIVRAAFRGTAPLPPMQAKTSGNIGRSMEPSATGCTRETIRPRAASRPTIPRGLAI